MKLFLILGIAIAFPCLVLSDNCHSSEFCKCVDIALDWLDTLDKGSIPVTENEVETMCTELEKAFTCADKFIDACVTPLQKELIALTTEGLQDFRHKFCAKGSPLAAKYIAHAPCLNKVSQMKEVREGMLYLLAAVEKFKEVPDDKKVTYACCAYGKIHHDSLDLLKNNCDEATVQTDKEFTEMIFGQLPEVICNGFTGKEEKCKAVLPPPGSTPSESLKGTEVYTLLKRVFRNWIE
ncbi:uncharacterized protein [Parasteatoda tepidariorum]|uniref:uncharacterized protein n=1 Tax=Parasteatoda tepidariorum TaxID=114398 RepID=UPI00077FC2D2|nr:uncharacterized protein LOC107454129 [Parasteatoda tepidariorum]